MRVTSEYTELQRCNLTAEPLKNGDGLVIYQVPFASMNSPRER